MHCGQWSSPLRAHEHTTAFDEFLFFYVQAEDGIRHLVRSRGLGDVYKRQPLQAGLPNPRLGWCGVIDERVNLELIRDMAQDLSLIHI